MKKLNFKNKNGFALYCTSRGWSMFPIHYILNDGNCSCGNKDCKNKGKHPMTPSGFKDATTDEQQISSWWEQYPEANIGIVTGQASGFFVLDIDPRHGGDGSLKDLISEYGELPKTYKVKTGGGGEHYYFKMPACLLKCRTGIVPGIDVKADGGYIIGAGSNHISGGSYVVEVDSELAEAPEWLLKLIEKTKKENKQQNGSITVEGEHNVIKEGSRTPAITSIIGSLISRNLSKEATLKACLEENIKKFKPPFTDEEIMFFVDDLYNRYQSSNYKMTNDKKKISKKDQKHIALFDGLVDIATYEEQPVFLVKENNNLVIKTHVIIDEEEYTPPPKNQIPWLLPRAEEVIKHYKEQVGSSELEVNKHLYEELRAYHTEVSELPEDCFYDLMVLWVFHSYLLEHINFTPYLCFYAVPERGKTRTGKGLIHVVYRGVHVESLRESYIFRLSKNYNATLFFDVMDLWKKTTESKSEDILLLRFEKGATVARVLYPEKGPFKDTEFYPIFGPTIIGTNEPLHHILGTRALEITMPDTNKIFEKEVKAENSLYLKEKLIAFRARYLGSDIPIVEKPIKGRLGDIMKPLLQVVRLINPEKEQIFFEILKKMKKDMETQKSETLEAQVLKVIIGLRNMVNKSTLPMKEITLFINKDKLDKYCYSPQRIGNVTKSLGFSKGKTESGASAIIWDENLIKHLCNSYGVTLTSDMSETSVLELKKESFNKQEENESENE